MVAGTTMTISTRVSIGRRERALRRGRRFRGSVDLSRVRTGVAVDGQPSRGAMADSRVISGTDGVDRCALVSVRVEITEWASIPGSCPRRSALEPQPAVGWWSWAKARTVSRDAASELPNPPLQSDEAREVPLGSSRHGGAPSLRAVLTIPAGPRR
jgi:hypothetical protein